jgi:ABC-type dipeptide/oligopeptide/nickel transport system permease subunit
LQGRACGLSRGRILVRHLLPNLRPILLAQFWTSIPAFILSEANLGMLGLGVGEPVPSWGNMLRQLQSEPHWNAAMLAPLALLVVVLSGFQLVFRTKELDI